MPKIQFFTEEINFDLPNQNGVRHWINQVIKEESKKSLASVNYIFTSDAHLLQINRDYLDHDNLTDIITFDHAETGGKIEADIFISIERIKENASEFGQDFMHELYRVMIHGILHLIGYSDKSETEKKIMRKKENECLNLL